MPLFTFSPGYHAYALLPESYNIRAVNRHPNYMTALEKKLTQHCAFSTVQVMEVLQYLSF